MGCGNSRQHDLLEERLRIARPMPPREPDTSESDTDAPKKRMRLTVLPSSGATVTSWMLTHLNVGHPKMLTRTKTCLSWLLRVPLRLWRLVRILTGPRIDQAAFDKRMAVCNECPSMQIRLLHKAPFTKRYCGPCNCWHWLPAELDRVKNWLLRWKCPQNKHERLDDPPEWAGIIAEEREWVKPEPVAEASKDNGR